MYQIASNNFVISPYYRDSQLVINDKKDSARTKTIKGHIKAGDYFGTLATLLDLTKQAMAAIEQNAKDIKRINKRNSKGLEKLRDDLMFLQKNYKISKNNKI